MSDGELSRLEVLRDLDQGRLTTQAAAQLLGLERRQVFRLLKAYRTEGATGLISKRRGRRSNRRKPEALRRAVLAMIREWYWDFGPTLVAEQRREISDLWRDDLVAFLLGCSLTFEHALIEAGSGCATSNSAPWCRCSSPIFSAVLPAVSMDRSW